MTAPPAVGSPGVPAPGRAMRLPGGSVLVVDLNVKRRASGTLWSRSFNAVDWTFTVGGRVVDVVVGTATVVVLDEVELVVWVDDEVVVVLVVVVDDEVVVVTRQAPDGFGKLPGSAGSVVQSSS